MKRMPVKIGEGGRIVIPIEFRKELGIDVGIAALPASLCRAYASSRIPSCFQDHLSGRAQDKIFA